MLSGSVNQTISINDAIDASVNDGSFTLSGSGSRKINVIFGSITKSFSSLSIGGTGVNSFSNKGYFENVSFIGSSSSSVVFSGGVNITDEVLFTASNQVITFGGSSSVDGGIDFGGFASSIKLDSSSGSQTFSGVISNSGTSGQGVLEVSGGNSVTVKCYIL